MIKQLINNIEDFQEWCRTLGDVIALDFETTSLNYLEMEFVGFSLCDGDRAMYTQNPDILFYLALYFSDHLFIFHNAVFDLKCCRKFCEYEPDSFFCTLVGAKLVDENLSSHSLKYLAGYWLGVSADLIKEYDEVSADTNSKEFIDYAMNDAIWTHLLYRHETLILNKEKLLYIAGIEMDFQRVLVEMEINGVLIDEDKLEAFRSECGIILHNIEHDMLMVFGKHHDVQKDLFGNEFCISPIKFGSTTQLISLVHLLGFVVDEKTPKGNLSIGKTYLQKMKGQHKFFDLLWRYRKLQKLMNGFITPLDGFMDQDGRIRPSYNMVRTGRLSCSKPNLQQLPNPKKEKLEFNHREIFIPKPGNVLIKADYGGQELRVLSEVTNDTTMVAAFQNDRDLHLTTANHIFDLGLGADALTDGTVEHGEATRQNKQKRHQAKNGVNFPIVYGATVGRIAKDNKVSKKEAERWLNGFFELYPGVKKSIDNIPKELRRFACVRTLFGRKRRFPQYKKAGRYDKAAMERQAFNMKIQGTSADIGKIAGILLLKALPVEAKIVLFVHDEWVVECPKEMSKEVEKIMKDCMENAVALRVRMVVDTKIVNNFGE
ncbi:MAG TPA: hypothetical protein ENH85_06125 [Candidatus Scalindua sp.]|nr:hypothetical protein [Candidatus Scalindua sp.]